MRWVLPGKVEVKRTFGPIRSKLWIVNSGHERIRRRIGRALYYLYSRLSKYKPKLKKKETEHQDFISFIIVSQDGRHACPCGVLRKIQAAEKYSYRCLRIGLKCLNLQFLAAFTH